MRIFTDIFINWLKEKTICRVKGHKSSDWMRVMWAPGHFAGYEVKVCNRCNKQLDIQGGVEQWKE